MSIISGAGSLFAPPQQTSPQQSNQSTNEAQPQDQGQSSQVQSRNDPPPPRDGQPVNGSQSTQNDAQAGQVRPPEARPDKGPPPSDAAAETVVQLQLDLAEDAEGEQVDTEAEVSKARALAEAAQQAYAQQAIIDRMLASPDSAVAGLFDTSEPQQAATAGPDDGSQSASLAELGEAEAAKAEDPFAPAD